MARGFADLVLDDGVNTFIATDSISIPTTKALTVKALTDRQRMTLVKRDAGPLEFTVNGVWADGGGRYWRDFVAGMMNHRLAAFDLGNGHEFRACEVEDVAGAAPVGLWVSGGDHQQVWPYTSKVLSLEPYSRAKVVTLQRVSSTLQPAQPTAPAVAVVGTTGSTAYSYALVAQYATGDSVRSAATAVANGNAVLTGANLNRITLPALPTGATGWRVVRTASAGTPATTGTIASGHAAGTLDDTGLAAAAYVQNAVWSVNATVAYSGTAPAEPTWQLTLVIPAGVTVASVVLQNTLSGDVCTLTGLGLTNGTYYVLIDASGGFGTQTPGNNDYGLLAISSGGFGATVSGTGDVDFTGYPPGLQEYRGGPPIVPVSNPITVSVGANGQLTSAVLDMLAPTRFIEG